MSILQEPAVANNAGSHPYIHRAESASSLFFPISLLIHNTVQQNKQNTLKFESCLTLIVARCPGETGWHLL